MSAREGLSDVPRNTKLFRGRGLLLDLDTEESVKQFVRMLPQVDEFYGVQRVRIWKSRSKGVHAFVEVRDLPEKPGELFLVQCALGSDPARELLNMRDCGVFGHSVSYANVLFKPVSRMERVLDRFRRRMEEFENVYRYSVRFKGMLLRSDYFTP